MDQELKQYLMDMESRTAQRFEQVQAGMQAMQAEIAGVKAELQGVKSGMRTLETRMDERMNAMEVRWVERFRGFEARLDAMEAATIKREETLEARLVLAIDRKLEVLETKLLTAFHDWAKTYEIRARGTTHAVVMFDERLITIEERLSKVERKLPL